MARSGSDEWDDDYEVYSASQVEGVLEYCEIEVVYDTDTVFVTYCPFHGNTDTPAFAVNKSNGKYICFNPSCESSGELVELIRRTKHINMFQALRKISHYKTHQSTPFADRLAEAMNKPVDFKPFPQDVLDRMKNDFPDSPGHMYMAGRGFEDDTLDYFDIGYSAKQGMVIVPMHDPKGVPIGLIGRSIEGKRFKNSVGLPKSKTCWNFHRAKKTGDTVIVCESSFDAMRIHQAGYPNVVALLGGHITDLHIAQLSRTFSKIIIMTDFDRKQFRPNCRMCNYKKCKGHRPGRDLGRAIQQRCLNKQVLWAAYDDTCIYPHNAKDASDMTDDEIRQCLKGAVPNLIYSSWGVALEEKSDLALAS
jgi:5S rRNA maturation endonuclease (ribonuclease M5)